MHSRSSLVRGRKRKNCSKHGCQVTSRCTEITSSLFEFHPHRQDYICTRENVEGSLSRTGTVYLILPLALSLASIVAFHDEMIIVHEKLSAERTLTSFGHLCRENERNSSGRYATRQNRHRRVHSDKTTTVQAAL